MSRPIKPSEVTAEKKLGCKAWELEIGTEFSCDEGRTWLVVRTTSVYVSEDSRILRMMCSPLEKTGLSAWEEVQLEDTQHVLLERNWKSNVSLESN